MKVYNCNPSDKEEKLAWAAHFWLLTDTIHRRRAISPAALANNKYSHYTANDGRLVGQGDCCSCGCCSLTLVRQPTFPAWDS